MLDPNKYPEEQEEELDKILLSNGYSTEQLENMYPEIKEAIIHEEGLEMEED